MATKNSINFAPESPQGRASRIRKLRKALRYSRAALCEKYVQYGLTSSALTSWESARWDGLTLDGAKKLVQVFQEEGLPVTLEWLFLGVGTDPIPQVRKQKLFFSDRLFDISLISQELKLFHQLHSETTDAIVTDDGMAPWLQPGDYVAGKRYLSKDIQRAIGFPSIIQTLSGQCWIRVLKEGNDNTHFTLICINPKTQVKDPQLSNVELISAAPIIWIRKANLPQGF